MIANLGSWQVSLLVALGWESAITILIWLELSIMLGKADLNMAKCGTHSPEKKKVVLFLESPPHPVLGALPKEILGATGNPTMREAPAGGPQLLPARPRKGGRSRSSLPRADVGSWGHPPPPPPPRHSAWHSARVESRNHATRRQVLLYMGFVAFFIWLWLKTIGTILG